MEFARYEHETEMLRERKHSSPSWGRGGGAYYSITVMKIFRYTKYWAFSSRFRAFAIAAFVNFCAFLIGV